MAQVYRNYQSSISTWLILIFFMSILILLGYSEIFQNSLQKNNLQEFSATPISSDILDNIKTIRFKNRLGKFTITRDVKDNWMLVEPRKMPAKSKTIKNILNAFRDLPIRTLHQYEPINLQSFSLNNPIMSIDFFTKLDEQVNVNIGLVNPINSTSYITVSGKDVIFQTDIIKNNLELLDLSDFINSNIFSHELADVTKIDIYHGSQNQTYNTLEKLGDNWISKRYKTIENERVNEAIGKILNIKSHMIVDTKNEELLNFINNYLKTPRYRLTIKTKKKTINYKITQLIKSVPELKLEKRQYFIVKSSERQFPHVIDKNYLENFLIQYDDIGPKKK